MGTRRRRAILWAALAALVPYVPTPATPREDAPPATAQAARPSRLQGAAFLERNRPVIGAAVIVIPEAEGGEIVVTTTDAHGAFRMDSVPDGAYTVVFQRAGLEPVRKEHVELKAPFRPTVEVLMRSGIPSPSASSTNKDGESTVTGRATDHDGSGIADLKIRLVRAGGSWDPIELVSGGDGGFSAANLPSGSWILEGRGLAYLPVRAAIPFPAGEVRVRLVLVPQPATYEPIPLDLLPPEEPIPPPTGS